MLVPHRVPETEIVAASASSAAAIPLELERRSSKPATARHVLLTLAGFMTALLLLHCGSLTVPAPMCNSSIPLRHRRGGVLSWLRPRLHAPARTLGRGAT